MKEFRTRAVSSLAAALLTVLLSTASHAALINIDSDTDGLATGSRGGEFDWRDGYVELFGFDSYAGSLTNLEANLTFSNGVSTVFPNDFTIVFFERNSPNIAIGLIGTGATNFDATQATIKGMRTTTVTDQNRFGAINADDAGRWGTGITKSGTGYTEFTWTNGANETDTTLTGSFDLTAGTVTGTANKGIDDYDAKDISAYYLMGFTAGKVNTGNGAPPSGDWNGSLTFTSTGGPTGGAVPEPSTATMVAMGMMTLLGGLRRRRR